MKRGTKAKKAVAKRPTETLSGVALGTAVYGYATETGCPHGLAVGIAIAVAFGPAVISQVVDAIKG